MRAAIVTAATGHGHLSAARALAEAIQAKGGTAEIVDAGRSHALVAALVGLYNTFLRRSPRWMTAFFKAVNAARLERLTYPLVRGWAAEEFRRIVPTAVLSVHPMVNHGIAETLAGVGGNVPFAVILTDLAPPFWRGWAEPRAAAITAPTPAAVRQLAAWGVPRDRLHLAPIPVRPAFRRVGTAPERRAALAHLGLEEGRLTVVLDAGSACRPSALRAYRALAEARGLEDRIQTVVLTGRNPAIHTRARGVAPPFPTAVLTWEEDPKAILAVADVLFTKPGGLTVSEALSAGIPLLLDACGGVMPQERGNARFVTAKGAGQIVDVPEEVPAIIHQIAPGSLDGLRERARAAVSGDASTVLTCLEEALGIPVALRPAAERALPTPTVQAGGTSVGGERHVKTYFITGATGALAPFLIHQFLHEGSDARFICLARRADAPERLRRRIEAICPSCGPRIAPPHVSFTEGDVTRPMHVDRPVDAVWHFAADLRYDPAAATEIYATNLSGTRHILDFSARSGACLYYISTAYVCGVRPGVVREDELICGQQFRNAYEESKAQGELVVREWMRDHPGIIFRPSIVLGDTRTGTALAFHGLYKLVWALWFLRERLGARTGKAGAALAELMLRIPIVLPCFSADAGINVVGAEYVTALLADLHRRPDALGRTFHLTNPSPPRAQTLMEITAALMGVRGMRLVESSAAHLADMVTELPESFRRLAGKLWEQLKIYSPYMLGEHPVFDMSNVALVAGSIPPHPPMDEVTLNRLFSFAIARRFRDIE